MVGVVIALGVLTACSTADAEPVRTRDAGAVAACALFGQAQDRMDQATDAWVAAGKPAAGPTRDAARAAWAEQPGQMRLALAAGTGTGVADELANLVQVTEAAHRGGSVSQSVGDSLGTAVWAARQACARV